MTDDEPTAAQKRHRKMVSGEVSPTHGLYATYTNYLCRCEDCRQANREYHRNRAAERRAEAKA